MTARRGGRARPATAEMAERWPSTARLSDGFWDRFVESTWQRKPAVFRGALESAPTSSGELFGLLKDATALTTGRSPLGRLRFYGDGFNSQVLEDFAPLLPTKEERSFTAYRRRLDRELDGRTWGIVLNAVHRYSPSLWSAARELMSGLFPRAGFPGGGVSVTSFIGPYETTPFAVHKDSEHVFTFPVTGEKVFHLWPYESLAERLSLGEALRFDEGHTPFRNELPAGLTPIELRGRPGDLMYWPPEYWHVGRGDGRFNATVAIGIESVRASRKVLHGWAAGLPAMRPLPSSATTGQRAASLRAQQALRLARESVARLSSDDFRAEVEDESWRLTSAYGFHPPVEPLPVTALDPDDTVTMDRRFPILARPRDGALVCFVNGHEISMTHSEAIARMIARLAKGGSFTVSALCDLCRKWSAVDGFRVAPSEVVGLLSRFVSLQALRGERRGRAR